MIRVGVIQITSVQDYQTNLNKIQKLIEEGKFQGAQFFFLPEVFYSMGEGLAPTQYIVEKNNEHYRNIQNLARENEVYLIGGSAATRVDGKIVNRAYNFDPKGNNLGEYDKIHLFACNLKEKQIYESKNYSAGNQTCMITAGGLKVGINICFDLRFCEQSAHYRKMGAHVLTYASAFTVPTGRAHWHTLLRARAIENQCFVIASAQWGIHNERTQTFGHSLVIDPWGEILLDLGEGEKVEVVTLDLSKIDLIRQSVLMGIESLG